MSLAKVNQEIRQIRNGNVVFLDGLEQALFIISKAYAIYESLAETQQARLLQIIFECIIFGTEGQIVDFSLNPPFEYLSLISCSIKEGDGVVSRVDGSNHKFTPSYPSLDTREPRTLQFPGYQPLLFAGEARQWWQSSAF